MPLPFEVYQYMPPVSEYPLLWRKSPLTPSSKYRPTVLWLSLPSPSWGNPCGPPPVSWKFPPTTPRYPTQGSTPPVPLPNKTLLTITDPPPPSVVSFLTGSRLGAPSWYYGGPPASCHPNGLGAATYTWISPLYLWIPPSLPPWYWRMHPRIGLRSQRISSATTSMCSCITSSPAGFLKPPWWNVHAAQVTAGKRLLPL